MVDLASGVRGALYGVAICDALPVEFKNRGTFCSVTKMRYNGNFDLPPGSWTDDTSMTLCLAQSLVENGGRFVLRDQILNYIRWMSEGYMSSSGSCFDIGNATRVALGIWQESITQHPPSLVSAEDDEELASGMASIDSALNKETSCGNGSLMRCIPISLVFHDDPESAQRHAETASLPTHPQAICIEACQVYTSMVIAILNLKTPLSKEIVLDAFCQHQLREPAMTNTFSKYKALDDWLQAEESSIPSSGFVVYTLQAALWAFFTTENFSDGALKVVNLGDDADTVGAVYGGLAGSYYGLSSIPKDWLDGLQAREILDPVVEGVVQLTIQRNL